MSNGHGVAVSVETSSFWAKNSSDARVRHGACRGRVAVSCNTAWKQVSLSCTQALIFLYWAIGFFTPLSIKCFAGHHLRRGAGIKWEALPPPITLALNLLAVGLARALILAAHFVVYTMFPYAGMPRFRIVTKKEQLSKTSGPSLRLHAAFAPPLSLSYDSHVHSVVSLH